MRLLNEYIDGPGLTVVIGAEHLDPEPAAVQPGRVDLRRRDRHRDGRRHRPDAHALLARDRRRRRRGAGGVARAPRSELADPWTDEDTAPIRPTTRRTDEPPTCAAASESAELRELQRERDDYYDRLLRKTAEFDNYRKRVERERREQADQAVADLLRGAAARRRRLRSRADGRRRREAAAPTARASS